jgi:hypothetical protein
MSSTRASVLIINQKQEIKHIDNETIEKKVEINIIRSTQMEAYILFKRKQVLKNN